MNTNPKMVPGRGVARARVWTTKREPILPADLSDAEVER